MMAEPARARMERLWRDAKPQHRDHYLDQYLDFRDRATEWDAHEWGLTGTDLDEAAAEFDRLWRDHGSDQLWPADVVPCFDVHRAPVA